MLSVKVAVDGTFGSYNEDSGGRSPLQCEIVKKIEKKFAKFFLFHRNLPYDESNSSFVVIYLDSKCEEKF